MFLIWSTYWMYSIFNDYLLRQRGGNRKGKFRSQPWYAWSYWPAPHLESILKTAFCLFGVLVELRLGHTEWRYAHKHWLLPGWSHFADFVSLALCSNLHYRGAVLRAYPLHPAHNTWFIRLPQSPRPHNIRNHGLITSDQTLDTAAGHCTSKRMGTLLSST